MERVGVIGGGQMGAGIAEVCARAGLQVILVESDVAAANASRSRVTASLERAAQRGKLSGEELQGVEERLSYVDDLDAMRDREIVVEAVVEDAAAKMDVFSRLDQVVEDRHAILASNTSSIPIMRLATATSRPEHVVGIHFFNPVPIMPLVELVPSLVTSELVSARAVAFLEDQLGKSVIRAADRAGFIVNALLIPYLLSAIRMFESGFATREDIDTGMTQGCGHPMGPLALADLIGLDTVKAVADSLYGEFRDPTSAAPALLCRMVEAGLLGRKAGRGFYDHEPAGTDLP